MRNLRNRVQLIGHLGNDPEVIQLKSGKQMVKFSLATNDSYTNKKGEKITNTEWHNIVAFGKTAEIAENYLEKGKEAMVVGKLTYNQYENDKGEKKYFTQIKVNDLLLM